MNPAETVKPDHFMDFVAKAFSVREVNVLRTFLNSLRLERPRKGLAKPHRAAFRVRAAIARAQGKP